MCKFMLGEDFVEDVDVLYGSDEVDAPVRCPHISTFSYWKEEDPNPLHGNFPIQIPFILYIGLRVKCKNYVAMHVHYWFCGCEHMWISLKLESHPSMIDKIIHKIIDCR
jgi:hypothetical protein